MKAEIEELISKLSSDYKIGNLFPKAILIAKRVNQKMLEKWLKLELYGYFDTNPEMTKEDEVPKYRTVAGLYYDMYGRPLIIDDPKYSFINEGILRNGISELENLSESKTNFIKLINPSASYLIKEHFEVDIHYFSIPVSALKNILDRIRIEILERMLSLEIEESRSMPENKKELKNELDLLVINNKLKEALEMIEIESNGDPKIKTEITLQKARINELERQERIGMLKPEEIEIQKIKIRAAILGLTDQVLK